MHIDFDWSPTKAAGNVKKHGVAFDEAMTIFHDPLAMSLFDTDHSADKERWITLGLTSGWKSLAGRAHLYADR